MMSRLLRLSLAIFVANALVFAEPVEHAAANPPCFDTEIVPILSKAGCNAGECHGAAAGRGGFRLSLLGADADADFEAIVFDAESRRVNQASPRSSLLILKPTGELDHGGDLVLEADSEHAKTLLRWIEAGAPRGERRKLVGLSISPTDPSIDALPTTVAIQAMAEFDDGAKRDVTRLAVLSSDDIDAITFDQDKGTATIHRQGQHVVVARFMDQLVASQWVATIGRDDGAVNSETAIDQARQGTIDQPINERLARLRIKASPPASSSVFIRRVTLNLTGRLPGPDEVENFIAADTPGTRVQLIDRLLASDAFVDYWTLRFGRWFHLHSLPNEPAASAAFQEWLRHEIANNASLDSVARELLLTTGDSHQIGPANFARMVNDARSHAELFGEVFMGVKLGCANCHAHPLDRWTQDDYHGLAAVFAKWDRGRIVRRVERGSVTNLRTSEPAQPRIPGERFIDENEDAAEELVNWLTDADNPYFAKSMVNRLWHAMMGRGLVEPLDDMRNTNPATHPELLNALARDFIEGGYDLRSLLRQIALSDAYARSVKERPFDANGERFYASRMAIALTPEILADAIADVTGVDNRYPGTPIGTRGVSIIDPLQDAPALMALGRCSKASVCDQAGVATAGLAAQLHLINGDVINAKLSDPQGRLRCMIAEGRSEAEIVNEFYVRAISRRPSDAELSNWCERLRTADDDERTRRLEDFVWSLLNSEGFRTNQ